MLSDERENITRIFYLPQVKNIEEFRRIAAFVRSQVGIRRSCTYNEPRALALRGTSAQMEQAAQVIKDWKQTQP